MLVGELAVLSGEPRNATSLPSVGHAASACPFRRPAPRSLVPSTGPACPGPRLEAAFLAYAAAVLVYVLVRNGLPLLGMHPLVDGFPADQLDGVRATLGTAVALVLAGPTIGRFAAEIASTRGTPGRPER